LTELTERDDLWRLAYQVYIKLKFPLYSYLNLLAHKEKIPFAHKEQRRINNKGYKQNYSLHCIYVCKDSKNNYSCYFMIVISSFRSICKQDVFMKHKCLQEWQISLTAMPTPKLLKNRSNAKFTSSNHLFYYSSNINSHGKVLSQGTMSWYIRLKSYP
jgi:hypothetical protein